MRRPSRRQIDELGPLLDELAVVYAEADRLFASWSCPASTKCCRFGWNGREPYVTSIEIAALKRALGRRGGALSPRKRALPLVENEGTCALLDHNGRCAIYESRPLGCRTYFCDEANSGEAVHRNKLAELSRRIQAIAAKHEPEGDRPRPLSRIDLG